MIDLYAESWESVLPRPALIEGRRRSVSTAGTPRLVLRYSTRAFRSSVSILWNTIISRTTASGAPQSDGVGVVGEEQYSPNLLQRAALVTFRLGAASISSRGDQGPGSGVRRGQLRGIVRIEWFEHADQHRTAPRRA